MAAFASSGKGKAPKNVIEHAYGKGVFFEDALNLLFSENYGTVIEKNEKKFTVVGDPDVSVEALSDEGVTLVAVVPVKPEVKISSYKVIKIKESIKKFTVCNRNMVKIVVYCHNLYYNKTNMKHISLKESLYETDECFGN